MSNNANDKGMREYDQHVNNEGGITINHYHVDEFIKDHELLFMGLSYGDKRKIVRGTHDRAVLKYCKPLAYYVDWTKGADFDIDKHMPIQGSIGARFDAMADKILGEGLNRVNLIGDIRYTVKDEDEDEVAKILYANQGLFKGYSVTEAFAIIKGDSRIELRRSNELGYYLHSCLNNNPNVDKQIAEYHKHFNNYKNKVMQEGKEYVNVDTLYDTLVREAKEAIRINPNNTKLGDAVSACFVEEPMVHMDITEKTKRIVDFFKFQGINISVIHNKNGSVTIEETKAEQGSRPATAAECLNYSHNRALFPSEEGKGQASNNYQPYGFEVQVALVLTTTVRDIITCPTYEQLVSKDTGRVQATGKMNPEMIVEGFGYGVQGLNIGDLIDVRHSMHEAIFTNRGIIEGGDDYLAIHQDYKKANPLLAKGQAAVAYKESGSKVMLPSGQSAKADRDNGDEVITITFKGLVAATNICGIYSHRKDV